MVTTGPGGTNAMTGVAGAWLDSTPCLFLSGQVKRPDRMFDRGPARGMRQLGVQEVDIVSIVRPITKYAVTVLDPRDDPLSPGKGRAPGANRAAGPGVDRYPAGCARRRRSMSDALRGFDPAELGPPPRHRRAARAGAADRRSLGRAERPLLFAGNGVRLARGEADFADWLR